MRTSAGPHVVGPLLLLVLALVAGACSRLPPGSAPVAASPIVTYQAIGGECPDGACGRTARIWSDGRVERSDGAVGSVEPAVLARLADQVAATDWASILAVPFAGECPRNVDGQEEVYTFHVAPKPVVVASCTTLVDPAQEPFRAVRAILGVPGG